MSCKGLLFDFTSRNNANNTLHAKVMDSILLFQEFIGVVAIAAVYAFQMSLNPALVVSTCSNVTNPTAAPAVDHSGHRSWMMRRLLSEEAHTPASNHTNHTSHASNHSASDAATHGAVHAASDVSNLTNVNNLTAALGNYSCAVRRMTTDEAVTSGEELHDHCSLAGNLGYALGVGILLVIAFALMTRYLNGMIVRFFLKDGELLFICSMTYCLGTCGLCVLIGFSPMAGAYIAGRNSQTSALY